jgi:hypothetical protein
MVKMCFFLPQKMPESAHFMRVLWYNSGGLKRHEKRGENSDKNQYGIHPPGTVPETL